VTENKRTLKQKAYQELKEFLGIALYLWLAFASLLLYKSIILSEGNISLLSHGLALLNALALAKVILIAQALHFAERFKEAPLIVPTIFKSAAFAMVLGCFKVLEEAGIGLYRGHTFSESIASLGGGSLKGILSLMLVLGVLLVPFFGFTELGRVFGESKLRALFFRSRHAETDSF
jgi:hypothetical protein